MSRIHTFISTSDLHMKYKLKMQKDEVIEAIKKSIRRAKKYTNDIEWSPEDASELILTFYIRQLKLQLILELQQLIFRILLAMLYPRSSES